MFVFTLQLWNLTELQALSCVLGEDLLGGSALEAEVLRFRFNWQLWSLRRRGFVALLRIEEFLTELKGPSCFSERTCLEVVHCRLVTPNIVCNWRGFRRNWRLVLAECLFVCLFLT